MRQALRSGTGWRATPGIDYLSADLANPRAMVTADITALHFPLESFDVVLCSHVLEHVPADAAAMREMCRVLAPGGWAMVMVPLRGDRTHEDLSITDPRDRKRLFLHPEHARMYGADVVDRLRAAGFSVTRIETQDLVDPRGVARMRMTQDFVFLCRKPAA